MCRTKGRKYFRDHIAEKELGNECIDHYKKGAWLERAWCKGWTGAPVRKIIIIRLARAYV